MAVKSIKGKADGCWAGMLAYDATKNGWSVSEYVGCKITNIQGNTTFVCGHPDVKLNDCTFKKDRGVECDFVCSFHLEADDDDSKWLLYVPPIQKSDDFNYIVSYSNYTDKWCEWGSISISIDEVNKPSSITRTRPWGRRTVPPPPRSGEEEERQPQQTPVTKPSDNMESGNSQENIPAPTPGVWTSNPELVGLDDGLGGKYWNNDLPPASEEIPDYTGPDLWKIPERGEPLAELPLDTKGKRRSLPSIHIRGNTGDYARDYAEKENWDPDTISEPGGNFTPAQLRELDEQIERRKRSKFMLPPKSPPSLIPTIKRWRGNLSSASTLQPTLKSKFDPKTLDAENQRKFKLIKQQLGARAAEKWVEENCPPTDRPGFDLEPGKGKFEGY